MTSPQWRCYSFFPCLLGVFFCQPYHKSYFTPQQLKALCMCWYYSYFRKVLAVVSSSSYLVLFLSTDPGAVRVPVWVWRRAAVSGGRQLGEGRLQLLSAMCTTVGAGVRRDTHVRWRQKPHLRLRQPQGPARRVSRWVTGVRGCWQLRACLFISVDCLCVCFISWSVLGYPVVLLTHWAPFYPLELPLSIHLFISLLRMMRNRRTRWKRKDEVE